MDDRSVEKIFGLLLQQVRKEKKLSQEKLAEWSDLDRTYISLLERGLRQPSLDTLCKISKALEMKISDLIIRFENIYEN